MEIAITVLDINSGVEYFTSSEVKILVKELLKNNYNNSIKVGYVFELDSNKYEVISVALPEISIEPVNNVNAYLKLYVKKV